VPPPLSERAAAPCRAPLSSLRFGPYSAQERQGVDGATGFVELEVQVGTGGDARRAHVPDRLPLTHLLADVDGHGAEVRVPGLVVASMAHLDEVAVALGRPAGERDRARA